MANDTPVEVDAVQWFPGKAVPGVTEFDGFGRIQAMCGDVLIQAGDWVVTPLTGNIFVVANDVFKQFYKPRKAKAS